MANRLDLEPILGAELAGTATTFSLGADLSGALEMPGLRLGVDNARAVLVFAVERDGKPGFHVEPEFKSPTGMSAVLDLPGASGGGALAHVDDQWRGALQAKLGALSISGLGILDGGEVPAVLLLLAAEFTPAIQLSFGFTLVGVGGVVGINRRPDPERISAAVTSGDLSKLLFPHDPVTEADRLLPVLNDCFEVREGAFVVGPMLKVGWGSPTLISATLGVLIADDGVTVLGRLAVILPFEEADLIHLEATISGRIDADGMSIDGSLANSHILMTPIEGDVRMRVRGGPGGYFALSAGGFDPSFAAPAGMSGMRRITTEISPGPILKARLEAYLAVTSTSVQFGARVDLTAGFDGFGIKGHAEFNALFIFSPEFRFETGLRATVSVECADFDVCSISLEAHLGGPNPWRIRGHASISILFFDVDVDIPELTWGGDSSAKDLPPAADPVEVISAALRSPEGWTATSREVPHLAQLRPGIERDVGAVHPLAEIGFRQHAVPLGTELQRMDGVPLATPLTLTISHGDEPCALDVAEQFVPRQFFDIDDTVQRCSAGYETLPGGFNLFTPGARLGEIAAQTEEYEIRVLGDEAPLRLALADLGREVRSLAGHRCIPASAPAAVVALRDPGELRVASRGVLEDRTVALQQQQPGVTALGIGPGTASALLREASRVDVQAVAGWELEPQP